MNSSRIRIGAILVWLIAGWLSMGLMAEDSKKLQALLIEGQNNHGIWPKTSQMMKQYLEETGRFDVEIMRTAPEGTDSSFQPDFSAYDVVVTNYNGVRWPRKTEEAFVEYMRKGGGLVVVHAANNAFGDWDEYNRMIGLGGWGGRNEKSGPYVYVGPDGQVVRDSSAGRGGNHGPQHEFPIIVRESGHPITQGLPTAWMHTKDELYDLLRGPAENMTILATAYADPNQGGTGRHEPMLMVVDYGEGRVFHSPMGHADYSMECVGFIATFQRGAEWAATGKVTQPIPQDFPSPDATSSRPYSAAKPAGGWPQWRGPERDGVSPEIGLLQQWPAEGPPLLWQAKGLGGGYASVAVADGRIYTMGSRDGKTWLIALDEATGEKAWETPVAEDQQGPNGTPTIDDDAVYAVSFGGDLVCCDKATGNILWRTNFPAAFGGKMMSGWGYSESPLVDGDRLICTPGAQDAILAALDKRTGKVIWKTAMPTNTGDKGQDGAAYSSIVISEAAGTRQYVQLVGRGVIGVAARDGRFLWGYNRIANGTANCPTPVISGSYVFASTGYGDGGSALLELRRAGRGGVDAREVYYFRSNQVQNHHGGMIRIGDHLYMGHGHNNGFPLCVHLPSGREVWRPGRGPGSGSAAISYADGHLYFRYQDGIMALIEATPVEYRLKGEFRLASRLGESWPHPAIANGRLYLRDQDVLLCYDVQRP